MQETMILKNKRLVVYAVVIFLMIWGIKGILNGGSSRDEEDIRVSSSTNLQSFINEETQLRQENLISTLKTEITRLRRQLTKCPDASVNDSNLTIPMIYAITPTHARPVQRAELTRLSHTLMLVPNLHWVIVEDAEAKSKLVGNLLAKTGMQYTHINAPTPREWKLRAKEPRWSKPRGVIQRNAALQWVRDNVPPTTNGVIYFVDDDNTYTLELFEEMRTVKTVGVWPVGLVGGLMVERPRINAKGKVTGWLTVWSPNRPFAIDMAGFAVSLKVFFQQKDWKFAYEVEKGYQESIFLQHFVKTLDDLEVKADNCTKVYVWHTRTEAVNLRQEDILKKKGKPASNLGIEV